MTLKKQVENAGKQRRKLAKAAPWLFPEYLEYIKTKKEFKEAEKRFKKAEKKWNNILGGQ